MIKQFNINQKIFADPILLIGETGNPILTASPAEEVGMPQYTTSGKDWLPVYTQDEINIISASITNGGDVWEENGKIHYSGKAPNEFSIFDRKTRTWVLSSEKRAEILESQRQNIRDLINKKRDKCVNGGVYVDAIDKWVDSDDVGRSTLVEIKADFDLNGRDNTYTLICADNTAKTINFDDFKAIWDAVKNLKEKMFENAYMHKVLLDSAEDPESYDWSVGWVQTYEEYLNEQNQK